MPKLQLLIGPVCAGKSFYKENQSEVEPDYCFSSDAIREELWGPNWYTPEVYRNQVDNKEVFRRMHDGVTQGLIHGNNCLVDSTHIGFKSRQPYIDIASRHNCEMEYLIFDRPLEQKYRDGGWRLTLDYDLIRAMHDNFQRDLNNILAGDGEDWIFVRDMRIF